MQFEFATATRIVFGRGAAKSVDSVAASFGQRAFFVTGGRAERSCFRVTGEPTLDTVRNGVRAFHDAGADVVVAIGGGSVLDAGKAIAALATNPGDPLDYLEVVGKSQPITRVPAPMIAVPTTAGTGTEVTRNAVLGAPEHRVKASLRSPLLLPRVAIVDPEMTLNLPAHITAYTGMDALTQCIEPYVSARANALTDLYCLEGIRRAALSLPTAYRDPSNIEARTDMAFASLLGGLSLANAGLGVVHGFAAPIGGMFDAPHGAVCAAILPHGIAANVRALEERAPQHPALERYRRVQEMVDVPALCRDLDIPPLAQYGITEAHVPEIAAKAANASSMKANPIVLTAEELEQVLARAIRPAS